MATQAGRATSCAPHVSWLTGLRRPALPIVFVLSVAGIAAWTLLRSDRLLSLGHLLLAGGMGGLLLWALAMGAIQATGGEVKLGPFKLTVVLEPFRRRLEEAVKAEGRALEMVAIRLCGDEDTARGLVEEVAYLAGRRWPDGTEAPLLRYLYCELLTRAAADKALGTESNQRAYLVRKYGADFADLDPPARTRIALERVALPADMVDGLSNMFGALTRRAVAPDAAMGTPNA